jgi:hypothetical protein
MVAIIFVRCLVSNDAEMVKQVSDLAGDDAVKFQAAQEIGLSFLRIAKESWLCGDKLRERLTVLTELEQRWSETVACARDVHKAWSVVMAENQRVETATTEGVPSNYK